MANFITNPFFANDLPGWTASSPGPASVTEGITDSLPLPRRGSNMVYMAQTTAPPARSLLQTDMQTIVEGQKYYVSCWIQCDNGAQTSGLELRIERATAARVFSVTVKPDGTMVTVNESGVTTTGQAAFDVGGTKWFNVAFAFTPQGSQDLRIAFRTTQPDGGESADWFIDDCWFGDTIWTNAKWEGLTGHLPRLGLRSLIDPISGEYFKEDDIEWDLVRNEWRGAGESDAPGADEFQDWYERPAPRNREPI